MGREEGASDRKGNPVQDLLQGSPASIPGIPSPEPRVPLLVGKVLDFLEENFLKGFRPWAPPPHLSELLIQNHHHRNGTTLPGEVRVHEIQVLIPRENPKVKVGPRIHHPGQVGKRVRAVSAPLLAENQ